MHNCLKITCAKTATYAVMHFVVAIAVAFALTGNWKTAMAIGLIEPFVQTFFFAVHERIWGRALGGTQGQVAGGALPLDTFEKDGGGEAAPAPVTPSVVHPAR